ncbi:MAG: nucleoside-diphosphate kinase [Candidatus Diapherotrites archaeon]|nr:nucleoside-diphosphate kinase [Candidatus Diapherotrites archaeon]
MEFEKTLILIKPEGVQLNKSGEIIEKFEKAGLKIIGMKMVWADEVLVGKHYPKEMAKRIGERAKENAEKRGEKFDTDVVEFGMKTVKALQSHITESPIIAIILEGPHAVENVRTMIGATSPHGANPGTIRGDLTNDSFQMGENLGRSVRNFVHASDSVENANREILLWFKKEEIYKWDSPVQRILYKY